MKQGKTKTTLRGFHVPAIGSPKAAQKRITAAEQRRDAKLQARRDLLASLAPSRDIPEGLIWVGIITKQAKEHLFAAAIEARCGAFCVIPLYDAKPRRKTTVRRPQAVSLPLLPRMIFAGFETLPNWFRIEATPHYSGRLELITGIPANIRGSEIVRLRDETEQARLPKDKRGPKYGDLIRIIGVDEPDEIERLEGRYAILKRMMLGQNIKVELSRVELLEAA